MSSPAEKPAPPFDGEAGELYLAHFNDVRGAIREAIPKRTLKPWLPSPPARILDFGGGDGQDTIWLAENDGYEVTLVDESSKMLEKAAANFDRLPKHVRDRISFEQGSSALPSHGPAYDLILSHGVLMYSGKPEDQLKNLAAALKPGGLLSLLTKGLKGAINRETANHEAARVRQLEATGSFVNNLGAMAWAYDSSRLQSMLRDAGFKTLDWSGLRVLSLEDDERRSLAEIPDQELQLIIEAEHEAGRDPEQRENGQMLHFIARKT